MHGLRHPNTVCWLAFLQTAGERANELDVQRMAGPASDQMAAKVHAKQCRVADQVEHLVPGRFVRVAQAIVDRALRAKYEDVGRRHVQAHSLALQLFCLKSSTNVRQLAISPAKICGV